MVTNDTGRILKAGGMTGIDGDNAASTAADVMDVNGRFNRGTGAPAGVAADRFAARGSGSVIADVGGPYRFQAVSDHGVRLRVDNPLVIDNGTLHGATTDTGGRVQLEPGGRCAIRLEYFENTRAATIRLRRQRPGTTTFAAIPIASVRGTAPPCAPLRFRTASGDGVRPWVNGLLLVDRWNDRAPSTNDFVALKLVAGRRYDVRLEYCERGGGAVMRLRWLPPGQTLWEPIPVCVLRPPGATP
jgi:hypothetical protein